MKLGSATPLGNGLYDISLLPGMTVAQALALYKHDPTVLFAQPNYRIHVDAIPNDPGFNQQWGLNNTGQNGYQPGHDIHAPAAWDITTGSGNTIVAVVDSGIDYTHPDLVANIWTNPNVNQDGFFGDLHGYNFVNNTGDPLDDFGHGTHVAGIIGAVGNNAIGVTGVAWHVQLMALKFLDSQGNGNDVGAIEAINFAVSHGATVINASWGGAGNDAALQSELQSAQKAGVIVVAAAGNNGKNTDLAPFYPADYKLDNIISVAATDRTDSLAGFSDYGVHTVDLAAPGVGILSTLPGGQYGIESGTSMATPYVTGAVALLHDLHPDWGYQQIIQRILATVDPLPTLEGKTVSGGRLDLAAALSLNDSSGPRVASATTFSSWAVSRVRITFDRPVVPSSFARTDVTSFVDPHGRPIATLNVVPVSGSNDRQFDILFNQQMAAGAYHFTIGPNISDFAGNLMNQDGDNQNGEPIDDRFNGSFSVFRAGAFVNATHVAIPDLGVAVSTITINQDVSIAALTVRVNISHTYDSDLYIHLVSPNGTDVVLSNRRGESGHNYSNTTFDGAALLPIGSRTAPFLGTFQADGLLSAFNGENAKGTWQLIVEDKAAGDVGAINSWTLTIGS
jgi:subtilisin-like proprotein convertase family protein